MPSEHTSRGRPIHHIARLSYLREMMEGKRILALGADLPLCRHCAESGASSVVAVAEAPPAEPWPESAPPEPQFRAMAPGGLAFDDASFDLAVVPDLTAIGEPSAALREIRRVTGERGHALVAAPNPECALRLDAREPGSALGYYALYDLLSEVFPSVQMVGQSPFVGYAVADLALGDEAAEIDVDASLLEGGNEEIEWFMAICGSAPSRLEPYAVIQVPLAETALGKAADAERLGRELADARREIGNRGVRIGTLEKDLENELKQSEKARERAVQVTRELDEERRKSQKKNLEEEYQKRTVDLDLQARVRELGLELKRAEERANAAEAGRDEMLVHMRADAAELDRLRDRMEGAEEGAARFADRERELSGEIDRLKAALASTSAESGEKQGAEISDLEARLRETGNALAAAEAEVARREAIVRDLVVELEQRPISAAAPDDESGRKVAELEGRLQAATWRVAEMEARNAELVRLAGESEGLEAALKEQLAEQREGLEKRLEAAERGARLFEDESRQQAVRAASLAEELGVSRSRLGALESQLAEAAEKQNRLENQLGGLAGRADAAEALSGQAEARIREALERSARAEDRLRAATSELDGARRQMAVLAAARDEAEASARQRVSEELQDANRLASEVQALASRLADTEQRFAEELNRGGALIATVESLRTALAGAESRVKMLEGEIDRSNENIASCEKELNELGREKDDALRQLKQATALGDSLEKKLEEMRKAAEAARGERDQTAARKTEEKAALREVEQHKAAIFELTAQNKEKEALLESLTGQLEEREQRATRLERQVRELDGQIKDHETDIVAWEAELKFRNTRISQLETEVADLRQRIEARALRPAPQPALDGPDQADSPVWSASRDDNPEALRGRIGQLNEALGDKDAELLILHGQMEEADRRLQVSRHALEELLQSAKLESALAAQLRNLLKSMQ